MMRLFSLYLQFYFLAISLAPRISPRDLTSLVLDCYDYVIVGGGVSALVVANRLTEDPDGMSSISYFEGW